MEKLFGNACRGDVPQAEAERFAKIGATAFSAITYFNPYSIWQLSNQFNWHHKAMLFGLYHWKQTRKKKEPYEFK